VNFPKSGRSILWVALAISTIACVVPAETNQETAAWGATVNGLQMSLSLDSTPALPLGTPAIMLRFRNVGNEVFRIIPESHCGPGPVGTSSTRLSITDSSGDTKRQLYFGPGPPYEGGCAGGIFVLDVPLAPGAEYSMPFNVDYYKILSATTHRIEDGWEPGGTYTLQAELTGSSLPGLTAGFWRGTVVSNKLEVRFPQEMIPH
jgi:hypothetical protein